MSQEPPCAALSHRVEPACKVAERGQKSNRYGPPGRFRVLSGLTHYPLSTFHRYVRIRDATIPCFPASRKPLAMSFSKPWPLRRVPPGRLGGLERGRRSSHSFLLNACYPNVFNERTNSIRTTPRRSVRYKYKFKNNNTFHFRCS